MLAGADTLASAADQHTDTEPNRINRKPPMDNEPRKPRTFTDGRGRTWPLTINVGNAMRVRDAVNINLLAPDTQKTILDLAADPLTLCAVLWHLLAEQAEAAKVEQRDFFDSLTDDSIEAATFAFLDALIDFFPIRRQGPLRRIVAKMREAEAKRLAHVNALVDDGRVDRLIDNEIAKQTAALDRLVEAPTPGT